MIVTITGNLLAETTATFPSQEVGTTQRASQESFQVGGKGVNAVRMLVRWNMAATAAIFPAGHTGVRCLDWLQRQQVPVQAFDLPGETRQGLVVRVDNEPAETTFLGKDLPLVENAWENLLAWLQKNEVQTVAICGSIPGWNKKMAEAWKKWRKAAGKRCQVAIDTYGDPLPALIRAGADLVKINRDEFISLAPEARADLLGALSIVAQKHKKTAWVITDGPDAIYAAEAGKDLWRFYPPRVKQLSPTGSGDVLLAGLVRFYLTEKQPLTQSLLRAVPYAAANAADAGVARFPEEAIKSLKLPLPERLERPSSSPSSA